MLLLGFFKIYSINLAKASIEYVYKVCKIMLISNHSRWTHDSFEWYHQLYMSEESNSAGVLRLFGYQLWSSKRPVKFRVTYIYVKVIRHMLRTVGDICLQKESIVHVDMNWGWGTPKAMTASDLALAIGLDRFY